MRKNSFYLWAMMAVAVLCIGFTSCGDDDDDDDNKASSTISAAERKLLGGWTYTMKNGHELTIVFQTDGKMCSGVEYTAGSIYTWQYNEQTGILSTDNGNQQWLITLISDNSWAGLELWNNNTPGSAERSDNFITIARLLLTTRQWKSDTGIIIEGFRSGDFTPGFYYNPRLTPHTPSGDSVEIDDITSLWLDKASEDREKDVITIQDKVHECLFEIYHPYDSKKIYFQYPTGLKFYPVY